MSISSEEESESLSWVWEGSGPRGLRFGGGPAGAGGRIVIAIVGGLQLGTARVSETVVFVEVGVAIAVVVCCVKLQSNPN